MYVLAICFYIGLGLIGSSTQFEYDGRIIGGEPADIKDIPYQLSLRTAYDNGHRCGASIISSNWAVTASHCVDSDEPGLILVAGTSFKTAVGLPHSVIKVIRHPSYGHPNKVDNDIAVLQVKEPFPLGREGVNCISLASSPPAVGALAQTSGWGYTSEVPGQSLPEQLHRVLIPIIDNEVCIKQYGNAATITEREICAGYKEGGKGPCSGDSGGPLVVNNKLVGITSFGAGCGAPYEVFARIDHFYSWVKEVTGVSDSDC